MTKYDKNNNPRKIYIVGDFGDNYANWMDGQLVNKMEDATLVLFTGGEDWDAKWYHKSNNPPHETIGSNVLRDEYEFFMFEAARKLNKKMIGICRGAQGGCVFAGGKLVQHQENPSFIHQITTFNGQKILTSSTHHQAQYPYNLPANEYKLLAWTQNFLSYRFLDSETQASPDKLEVEVCFYPKINFLSIQGHMEMLYHQANDLKDSFVWHRDVLDRFMADNL